MRRFPVIIGPTASGKSDLAVELALALRAAGRDAHIVSADAFQVYRGMDIGTAKPSDAQRRLVPHHLIDIVEPTDPFTVADWLSLAVPLIESLKAQGVVPIVVGGTHFYIQSFLFGLMEVPDPDPDLRRALQHMDPQQRLEELRRVDPDAARRIHPNDARRIVRALEVYRLTGRPLSQLQQQWGGGGREDCRLVAVRRPVDALNRRINARVRAMIDAGLLDETRTLHDSGRLGPTARQALGYRQLLPVLEGQTSLEDAVEAIKIETRRFARNQRTWIRRLTAGRDAIILDADDRSPADLAQDTLALLCEDRTSPSQPR